MRFYTTLAALVCFAFLNFQCGDGLSDYEGTVIKGNIEGASNLQVYLDKMMLNNTANIIDKTEIDGSGKFTLKIENPEDVVYRLRIGAKSTMVLANADDKVIELKGSIDNFQNFGYELTASKDAAEFKDMMSKTTTGAMPQPQLLQFINSTSNPLSALFAALVGRLNPEQSLEVFKKINTDLTAKNPDSPYAKDLGNIIAQTQFKLSQQKIRVGEAAPDINEADPNGKNIALSSLKGSVVLVDFWASWCRPCRFNNPKLVALHNKYKDKGFKVYSVSLDKDTQKERWKQAIKDDKLDWPYHVSDLKGWACVPAKAYGVRSIPQTFLLDKEGKIAAINPRGEALEQEVAKLLGGS